MYTEIATIKDKGSIAGFLVYDGQTTSVMDVETMKREASAGNVDTLSYKDGKFIPILQGPLKDEMKKAHASRQYERQLKNMTFEDFVSRDGVFELSDVKLMEYNPDVILATAGLMLDATFKGKTFTMVTISLWTQSEDLKEWIKWLLDHYKEAAPYMEGYRLHGGSFLFNYVPGGPSDILNTLSIDHSILWNLEAFDNMEERTRETVACMPWLIRLLAKRIIPTTDRIEEVKNHFADCDRQAREALNLLKRAGE